MKKDLMAHGIVPAKSMILKPVKLENYNNDFWRGCVDGDGSIMRYRKNGLLCRGISLVGTYDITKGFYKYVGDNFGPKIREPIKDGSIFRASYQGSATPIKVIELLYNGSDIYLDRKMDLAREAIMSERRTVNNYVDRSRFTNRYLSKQYKKFGTWEMVAKDEKISISTLYRIKGEL